MFAGGIIATYVVWEIVGEAPQGMVTLVGIAGGALFGAVSGDKTKRANEVAAKADHAERVAVQADRKADQAAAGQRAGDQRADAAEARETEPSIHREDDGGE